MSRSHWCWGFREKNLAKRLEVKTFICSPPSYHGALCFLGGETSNIFCFHPDPWGHDPIGLYLYISISMRGSTTNQFFFVFSGVPFQSQDRSGGCGQSFSIVIESEQFRGLTKLFLVTRHQHQQWKNTWLFRIRKGLNYPLPQLFRDYDKPL